MRIIVLITVLISIAIINSCASTRQKFYGKYVETKMGPAMKYGDEILYIEWKKGEEPKIDYGQEITIEGEIVIKDDLPVFIMTEGMKNGTEPIPSGIPVESEKELEKEKRRKVLVNSIIQ
jgi:hypothetical protein